MKKRGGRNRGRPAQALKPDSPVHPSARLRSGQEAGGQPSQAQGPGQVVQIEKPIYGGAFLARVEGKAMFVPLTLPGEEARVRIVEEKRGYAAAEVEEVLTAAPE